MDTSMCAMEECKGSVDKFMQWTLMGFCSNYVLIKIYLVDWAPGRLNTMLPYMDAVCLQNPLAKTNTKPQCLHF